MYTDSLQAFILIIGSAAITYFGLSQLENGWSTLREVAGEATQNFKLWRPNSDPDFPWLGILIASPIIGIWYWCTDQYIVQRTLAAKDLKTARRDIRRVFESMARPYFLGAGPHRVRAAHEGDHVDPDENDAGRYRSDQRRPSLPDDGHLLVAGGVAGTRRRGIAGGADEFIVFSLQFVRLSLHH